MSSGLRWCLLKSNSRTSFSDSQLGRKRLYTSIHLQLLEWQSTCSWLWSLSKSPPWNLSGLVFRAWGLRNDLFSSCPLGTRRHTPPELIGYRAVFLQSQSAQGHRQVSVCPNGPWWAEGALNCHALATTWSSVSFIKLPRSLAF